MGIEVARSKTVLFYVANLLEEIGMLEAKPIDKPMDSNTKFSKDEGEELRIQAGTVRLAEKLIY